MDRVVWKKEEKIMLFWLEGDPLSGIGTTIGFFVFLIIGRYLRIIKEGNINDNR